MRGLNLCLSVTEWPTFFATSSCTIDSSRSTWRALFLSNFLGASGLPSKLLTGPFAGNFLFLEINYALNKVFRPSTIWISLNNRLKHKSQKLKSLLDLFFPATLIPSSSIRVARGALSLAFFANSLNQGVSRIQEPAATIVCIYSLVNTFKSISVGL